MSNLRSELRTELEAAGVFEEAPGRVYAKFLALLAVTIGLFAAAVTVPSWWAKVPLFVAGLAANIGVVMLGHDSGHGAVSKRRWLNDPLGYFCFPLFAGMPLVYWKWKHNTLHHSYPNVSGKDPDIDIYPFAMHEGQRVTTGFKGLVQRSQAWTFWPVCLFATFAMRWDGIHWHWTKGRKLAPALDRWIDIACFSVHYVLWLVVPPLFFGVSFWAALGFYVAWSLVSGLMLAAIFLPAHMEAPLYKGYEENFVLQLRTTQNLLTNPVFSYLLIGLDHQIEHHLFQKMSHLQVQRASPIVRAFCARHGLPYTEKGWGAALLSTTLRFDELPFYSLVDKPPRQDGEVMGPQGIEKGTAEFSDGREALEAVPVG